MASADISVALQKLLKGAEEDIAGNYFKPVRANKLIAQAHETQRAVSKWKGTISYRHTCHVKGSTIFHGNFQNMQRTSLLPPCAFTRSHFCLSIIVSFKKCESESHCFLRILCSAKCR